MAERRQLEALVDAVLTAAPRLGPVRLVTIDGPSGSGKTTLAGDLGAALTVAGLDVALVRTDHFATWHDPFGWWERLEDDVLRPLAVGRAGGYVANDWSGGEPVPILPMTVPVPAVLLLEGVSAGRRCTVERSSLAIWVEHPDPATRLERAVARDGEQIRAELVAWQLDENRWFADDLARERADVVLSSG